VCGGTYTDSQGVISSPYYPNHYPLGRICEYRIIGPLGTVIEMKFLDLDIEMTPDSTCVYDYLEVSNTFIRLVLLMSIKNR
jgi:cubilin